MKRNKPWALTIGDKHWPAAEREKPRIVLSGRATPTSSGSNSSLVALAAWGTLSGGRTLEETAEILKGLGFGDVEIEIRYDRDSDTVFSAETHIERPRTAELRVRWRTAITMDLNTSTVQLEML